jgi:hypothetical protein
VNTPQGGVGGAWKRMRKASHPADAQLNYTG